jgi:hypothetical protein
MPRRPFLARHRLAARLVDSLAGAVFVGAAVVGIAWAVVALATR